MQTTAPFKILYDEQQDMVSFVLARPPYTAMGGDAVPEIGMVVHATEEGMITEIEVERASKRLDLAFLQSSPSFERVFDPHDIRRIQESTGLSDEALSARLDVSVQTLRKWAKGTQSPKGIARRFLETVRDHPEVLR